jgi:LPXTG-site transpeptidase (sortase) family protein
MGMPYSRRRRSFSVWQFLLIAVGIGLIVFSYQQLNQTPETPVASLEPGTTPTVPRALGRGDVLPTPTIDYTKPQRSLVFPAAALTSRIIEAIRTDQSWETRYLGESVGHLEGTGWFNDIGANIVLAGHVENENGAPGPFAYLFKTTLDDLIILQEGSTSRYYKVTRIEHAKPDQVEYVSQDGIERLTLITCTGWDYKAQTYEGRLVVIAEPVLVGEGN